MKLVAITDRSTKKDYIDLYFLAQKYSFEEMFRFYENKQELITQEIIRAGVNLPFQSKFCIRPFIQKSLIGEFVKKQV